MVRLTIPVSAGSPVEVLPCKDHSCPAKDDLALLKNSVIFLQLAAVPRTTLALPVSTDQSPFTSD